MGKHVEFVSYDGRYPNLCTGKLVLKIDDKDYCFYFDTSCKGVDFPAFWHSGGSVTADADWNFTVSKGHWEINVGQIPEQFRKYAAEIDEAFNDNVPYGCCGGCV